MAVVSITTLKSYFETGDFPTESQFEDLIDTLGVQNNLKTVEYTVGVAGVTGVDYNFASVADHLQQDVQLGVSIIPADTPVLMVTIKCIDGFNGAAIMEYIALGKTAGTNEYYSGGAALDDTNETASQPSSAGTPSVSASSVWFAVDPDTNWNVLTNGKWKIWITYIDNSLL